MPPEAMLSIALLQAESACRALVLQAAALADAGDADALAALFSADARLTRPNGAVLQGRDAIAASYRERAAHRLTVHLICGTLFSALEADAARASSHVLLWTSNALRDAGPQGRPADRRQLVGRFVDRFVRLPEGWRIAERVASFDMHAPD